MAYENEFSNFPDELITLHGFKDVDDNTASLINQINQLRENGDYATAAKIIEANEATLSPYLADSTVFRTWEEEIYNTQVYALKKKQDIYFTDNEPSTADLNDVWVSDEGDEISSNVNYQNGYSIGYTVGYSDGVTYADSRVNTSSVNYLTGYNQGISDADDRVNKNSTNYQSGYSAGYSEGYNLASGSIKVYEKTITSSGTAQSASFEAEGTVLCAGVKTSQFQVASYDESSLVAYREMTAYTTCTYSGTTITVTVAGGNQSNTERNLTAVVSYAVLE